MPSNFHYFLFIVDRKSKCLTTLITCAIQKEVTFLLRYGKRNEKMTEFPIKNHYWGLWILGKFVEHLNNIIFALGERKRSSSLVNVSFSTIYWKYNLLKTKLAKTQPLHKNAPLMRCACMKKKTKRTKFILTIRSIDPTVVIYFTLISVIYSLRLSFYP